MEKMMLDIPALYQKYFINKNDERVELFQILTKQFNIKKGLYPGSFVHISPSFSIPEIVYIDNDKRCKKFFADNATIHYINQRKKYKVDPIVRFHESDFTNGFQEKENYFDLLISLYSGFVSKYCGKYLKRDGILIANNSHGDSSLAYLDTSFTFIGVVKRRGNDFSYSDKNLNDYFITKNGNPIDRKSIEQRMIGAGFTKTVYAYIFCRIK